MRIFFEVEGDRFTGSPYKTDILQVQVFGYVQKDRDSRRAYT